MLQNNNQDFFMAIAYKLLLINSTFHVTEEEYVTLSFKRDMALL